MAAYRQCLDCGQTSSSPSRANADIRRFLEEALEGFNGDGMERLVASPAGEAVLPMLGPGVYAFPQEGADREEPEEALALSEDRSGLRGIGVRRTLSFGLAFVACISCALAFTWQVGQGWLRARAVAQPISPQSFRHNPIRNAVNPPSTPQGPVLIARALDEEVPPLVEPRDPVTQQGRVGTPRFTRDGRGWKVAIPVSRRLRARVFELRDPQRIVVDLPGAVYRGEGSYLRSPVPHVAAVRVAQREGFTRVVLDVHQNRPALGPDAPTSSPSFQTLKGNGFVVIQFAR